MGGINRARQLLEIRKTLDLQNEFSRGSSLIGARPPVSQEFTPSTPTQQAAIEEDYSLDPSPAGGVPMWAIGAGVLGIAGLSVYFLLRR